MTDRSAQHDAYGDADLLAELRDVVARVDAIPPDLIALAEASFALRTLDVELATLIDDFDLDADPVPVMRGAPARLLSFEAPSITLEIQAVAVGHGRRLLGQVLPPQAGPVEVRHPGGMAPTQADDLGRFAVTDIEPGPVRVRCRIGGRAEPRVVDTDWFIA